MDKSSVRRYAKEFKNDVKKVKTFIDDYFVFDACNCTKCNNERNKGKLDILLASITTFDMFSIKKNTLFDTNTNTMAVISEGYGILASAVKTNNKSIKNNGLIDNIAPSKRIFCTVCGKFVEKKEGRLVCNDCLGKFFKKCNGCGEYIIKDNHFEESNKGEYCTKCLATLIECKQCKNFYPKRNVKKVKEYIDSRGQIVENGGYMCKRCTDRFVVCKDCGILHHRHLTFYIEDKPYCTRCSVNYKFLYEWDYKPSSLKFKRNCASNKVTESLYFGCELEVEKNERCVYDVNTMIKKVSDLFGERLIFGKNDGSLDNGFEFVTHPFSWDWFLANKYRFNQMFSTAKLLDLFTAESCGCHVHMTKSVFTPCHLLKFMKFINSGHNVDFISKIAGREYANISFCKTETDKRTMIKKAKKEEGIHLDRYSAVNLVNKATVEVRIFNGTLDSKTFFSYIEFLKSLFDFTNLNSMQKCQLGRYKDYVLKNKTHFPQIVNKIN